MRKLRLLVTLACLKNCSYCCNKDYDIKGLPEYDINSPDMYDEIMITGGEPLLFFPNIIQLSIVLRDKCQKLFLYTADPKLLKKGSLMLLPLFDGITVSLHREKDLKEFYDLMECVRSPKLRFKVPESFKDYKFPGPVETFQVSEKCPLPDGEEFMRLPKLFNLDSRLVSSESKRICNSSIK